MVRVKALQDVTAQPVEMDGAQGVQLRLLIGPQEGAPNFHMRHFAVAPGGHTPHHQHDYEHEVLVLKGAGVAVAADAERTIGPGDVVWVPPNAIHQFRNTGDAQLEFICLIPAPQDCSR